MTRLAPGLPDDLSWINCRGDLDVGRELAGHVVLFYFWTASCVHSRQGLRVMARLQQRFAGQGLAIVGVHSGRFEHERGIDAVRRAVDRFDVRFPVAVDDEFAAWRLWGATGWPYMGLVESSADGLGSVIFQGLGEPNAKRLVRTVARMLDEANTEGRSTAEPYRPRLAVRPRSPSGLRYPTRLMLDGEVLWMADTGHHRVLGVDANTGKVLHAVGSGLPGFVDGAGPDAALCQPGGMGMLRGDLWIADRGNHLLRTFDPATGVLTTAMGTGRREQDCLGGYCGRDQGLHGPSDVVRWDDPARGPSLLVAQSGGHQLWVVDGDTMVGTAVVGTGGFGSRDDRDDHASIAQPEGLAAQGARALWVEGATGALRLYDGGPRETTTVLDGATSGLHEPCHVAWSGERAIVLDTGGGRLLCVDVDAGTAEAIPLATPLSQPEGIAVRDGVAFVADTGAHRLVRVDLESGAVTEFALSNVPDMHPAADEVAVKAEWVEGGEVLLRLHLALPMGAHVEEDSGVEVTLEDSGEGVLTQPMHRVLGVVGSAVTVPGVAVGSGSGEVYVEAAYLTRTSVEGAWHRRVQRWLIEVELTHDGAAVQDLR